MTAIRVLRVLEYTYHDSPGGKRSAAERMADDITHWGVGATATMTQPGMTIKSATFLPEIANEEDSLDVETPTFGEAP